LTAPSGTGRSTAASLRVRNFRLYWVGQLISQIGTWLSLTAVSWVVLTELHGTGTDIGVVAAAQFLPTLLVGTWAGVLADRRDVRRLLLITQSASLLVATLMAALQFADRLQLPVVVGLVAVQGLAMAFDNPARQALLGELVGPELVTNAVALNSAAFNCARIAGPAIAGLLIQFAGTRACFTLNAVSYLAALGGLIRIDRGKLHGRPPVARAKGQIRQGLRHALDVPALRAALLTMAVVGTVSMNFTVLVPLLARTTFRTGAAAFGLLTTSMGIGSLVGSLRAARNPRPSLTHLSRASFALGLAMVAAAVSPAVPVAMVALTLCGMCVMTFLAATNAILQLNSRPDMRGRVMSLYIVLFIGTSPVGGPVVGAIAQALGTRAAFVYGALGAFAGGALAARYGAVERRGSGDERKLESGSITA
jgi:MFS family permease